MSAALGRRLSNSGGLSGIVARMAPRRPTGASRYSKASSWTVAAISAPQPAELGCLVDDSGSAGLSYGAEAARVGG
jgi:hypothetical protein